MKVSLARSHSLLCPGPLVFLLFAAIVPIPTIADTPAGERPAVRSPHSVSILPDGRLLAPAGRAVPVAAGPFGLCLTPDGRTLIVSSSGPGPAKLTVIRSPDHSDPSIRSIDVPDAFMGLAVTSDGRTLFASGGDDGAVIRVDLATGTRTAVWRLNGPTDGTLWRQSFTGDLALSADGSRLYAIDIANYRLVVVDTASGRPIHSVPVGRNPFGLTVSPDGRRLYVSNSGTYTYRPLVSDGTTGARPGFPLFPAPSQAAEHGVRTRGVEAPGLGSARSPDGNSVWTIDVSRPGAERVVGKVNTGWPAGALSPQGFAAVGGADPVAVAADRSRFYVANAANDTVQCFDAAGNRVLWTASLSPPPFSNLRGVTPFGMALAPNGRRLYVAEAALNAVGVVDTGSGRLLGSLPVAAWPCKLQISPDGRKLYAACALGFGSGSEHRSTQSATQAPADRDGAVCTIDVPSDEQLAVLTARVRDVDGIGEPHIDTAEMDFHVQHRIRYVVLIVKEGRSFDEVFGDDGRSTGDPSLARFGRNARVEGLPDDVFVTPNATDLARRFSVCDNYYAQGETSAEGHRWLVGAVPDPWRVCMDAMSAAGRCRFSLGAPGRRELPGPWTAMLPEEYPEAGTLWDNLVRHNVTFRAYGEGFDLPGANTTPAPSRTGVQETVNAPMPLPLYRNASRTYPSLSAATSDQRRVDRFIEDYRERGFDSSERMPRFLWIDLPNDRGGPARPRDGYPYDASYVADNDLAVGRLVEFLSNTPHWNQMAIFVTESCPNNAVDSVDRHRTLCLVASPWARQGYISHTHTCSSSLLHTIDLLLGLPPLNLEEALAGDLTDCFTARPTPAPYSFESVDPRIYAPPDGKASDG